MLLLILLSLIAASSATPDTRGYRTKPIPNNPGLIYEKLGQMRFTNDIYEIRKCQQWSIFYYNDIEDLDTAAEQIQKLCNEAFEKGGMFQVYKMHSLRAPQDVNHLTTNSYAYVNPKKPFIAVSFSKKKYFMFDEFDHECNNLDIGAACLWNGEFLKIDEAADPCEVSLVRNPFHKVTWSSPYKNCDIKVDENHQSEWSHLPYAVGWLYSINSIQPLKIECSDGRLTETIVDGTGILDLMPGCSAQTPHVKLPANPQLPGATVKVYIPPYDLNLHELSKTYNDEPWAFENAIFSFKENKTKSVDA